MLSLSGPDDFAEAFNVPHETIHRLRKFAALLTEWQQRVNLVSATTLPDLWHRHFADSAQLIRLAPDAELWLDLGSGAGFPGLVVAILQSHIPGFSMHLVESTQKKCAFLTEAARVTETPVVIHCARAESLAESRAFPKPDVVSARALAPLPQLLQVAQPFFAAKTTGLFLKGRHAEEELKAARQGWSFTETLHPSLTADEAAVIEIAQLRRRKARGR